MIRSIKTSVLAITALGAISLATYAGSHTGGPPEVGARHGEMMLISLNMGVVGNMARGRADYDADAAQRAADSLAAIGMIDQFNLWPEGTDQGAVATSRAKPEIWSDWDGFLKAWDDFGTAALALQAVAGDGKDAMAAAMGDIGKSCGACHDAYRGPRR